MPVSVVAKWSSRGEPRFVEMLDALTRACDGVPIARDEVKTPTSAVFSNLVVCIFHFMRQHTLFFFNFASSQWYASLLYGV